MEKCICKGNWISLIEEYFVHFGETFIYKSDNLEYIFEGIMWAEDDFYYVMTNKLNQATFHSCVGRLSHNFTLKIL